MVFSRQLLGMKMGQPKLGLSGQMEVRHCMTLYIMLNLASRHHDVWAAPTPAPLPALSLPLPLST